jgi:hypothetical protein
MSNPTKAIAVGGPQQDLTQVMELARVLSVSALLPDTLKGKPADVLVTVLYGQELGLAPMQAMQSIYVVKGRPTISAHLWVALARRAGHKVRVIEETAESCTVEVERSDDPGRPTRVTWTVDQARAAGLLSNSVWKNHTAAMLYARAVSTACRRACPEIAMGFGDESERHEPEPDRPTLAQVAAERADVPKVEQPATPEESDEAEAARMLAEIQQIQQEHQPDAVDAEVVEDEPIDVTGWPEVKTPGGAR